MAVVAARRYRRTVTDHRRSATAATLVVSAAAAALTLSGCGLVTPPACADWGTYDPQQAYEEASLVVEGIVGADNGRLAFTTGPGIRHQVSVEAVLKGEYGEETLDAAAPRDYCVADPPEPAEDPLQEGDRVLLFLHPSDGGWSTLTPYDGVLPYSEGDELPFAPD